MLAIAWDLLASFGSAWDILASFGIVCERLEVFGIVCGRLGSVWQRVRSFGCVLSVSWLNMVRVAPDGKLSLSDLIREWTNLGNKKACRHIQMLTEKGVVPRRAAVCLGVGRPSHVVTADEWAAIKSHAPCQECRPC